MKILDRYILTSFITTFASVFIILFFIFVLQGIWLFIAELAGKDLDIWLVLKFLAFYSPKIVPLVLPLSILLASIMTFGSFAENYEFAAMKSSGISLSRAMRSLSVFIGCLSIVAFIFANSVIPKAEFKFLNLRKNIIQRKPAMAIAAGQFNAIGNFNIKVDKKSGDNDEKLTGVTIHKRNLGSPYVTIIRSKKGLLKSSESSNLLQLELFDGYYYEEITSNNPSQRQKQPFAKSSFTKQIMNIDLTMLNSNDMDDEKITHTNTMLNISELSYTLDSLENNYAKESKSIADNITQRYNSLAIAPFPHKTISGVTEIKKDSVPKDLLGLLKADTDKSRVLDIATNNLNSSLGTIKMNETQMYDRTKNINGHWLALYEKFVIAFSCLLMFFIGAPLGAIIRKGGLGLPIVFAVLIFIVFHFINTFGRKLAGEDGIPPFLGSWMSSFVLSPLAVLLTYRATKDLGVSISFDWLTNPIKRLFEKDNSDEQPILNIDTVRVTDSEEWINLKAMTDDELIYVVKNTKMLSQTPEHRKKALKVLESRGILQENLKEDCNLYNLEYLKCEFLYNKFKISSNIALGLYVILLGLSPFVSKGKTGIMLPALICLILFFITAFKAAQSISRTSKILNEKISIGLILNIVLALPFYLILYFYNRAALQTTLKRHNYKF
ncbi:LptF/LptG family permease [Flavobacterium sp. DG1-102-2]|nr:LptF/LptG family permease [Flavobacterium sp. DG1-102-2]MDV6166936.1 LptF/LptG family permease [Flavobacterium sp. DG1-102-2]